MAKTSMNVRNVDENPYNEFKSAVNLSHFKSVKDAISSLMKAYVSKSEERRIDKYQDASWDDVKGD